MQAKISWKIYLAATRPAFLTVTYLAAALALSLAKYFHYQINYLNFALASLVAIIFHATANVYNDYQDARNGGDALNHQRIYPFTGGSRLIQNGILTLAITKKFATWLLASGCFTGILLLFLSSFSFLLYGVIALLLSLGYSMPPFKLQARGLGEIAITLAWLTVIAGVFSVSTGHSPLLAMQFACSYAFLVASLLLINQFPDFVADQAVGKNTIVVRLGLARARYSYLLLLIFAHLSVIFAYFYLNFTKYILLSLLSLFPGSYALQQLWRNALNPAKLKSAIIATIITVHAHGILLIIACFL